MSATAQLAPPPSRPPAVSTPGLADLILLRLLPASKSISETDLRKELAVFFSRIAPVADEVTQALTGLRAEGYVTAKGQRATDAGRARALQFLGVEQLPAKANWGTVKAKFLVPRALGISADSAEYTRVTDGETLAAFLLRRVLNLPKAGRTVTAVVDAFLCRELGHPEFTRMDDLIRATLGKALGGSPINKSDAKKALPRIKLDVPNCRKEQLLDAILAGKWSAPDPQGSFVSTPQPLKTQSPELLPEPFDLEAFANTVKAAARTCPTGRFGETKVFISHVWEQLRSNEPFRTLGLAGFKERLVEANQALRLSLIPADLNQAFDDSDISGSRTQQRNSTYHLIDTGAHA